MPHCGFLYKIKSLSVFERDFSFLWVLKKIKYFFDLYEIGSLFFLIREPRGWARFLLTAILHK